MKKRHTAEQIAAKLREAEAELAKGRRVREVVRKLRIAEQSYPGWMVSPGGSSIIAGRVSRLGKWNPLNLVGDAVQSRLAAEARPDQNRHLTLIEPKSMNCRSTEKLVRLVALVGMLTCAAFAPGCMCG